MAASNAMENLPVEVRGIASGFLQQGYAVGYLIAAVINLFLVPEVGAGWRSLFWMASGISIFAAFVRLLLPESEMFLRADAVEASKGHDSSMRTKVFIQEIKLMLKRHWLLCIYGFLFMTGMCNLYSLHRSPFTLWRRIQFHFSWIPGKLLCIPLKFILFIWDIQDLYPTYLTVTKGLSNHDSNMVVIIANCVGIIFHLPIVTVILTSTFSREPLRT